jgi:predicted nucleic acid-binding protein
MLRLVLDTNVLGRICHPKAAANRVIAAWALDCLSSSSYRIVLPEVADYEYRRVLNWRATHKGIAEAKESLRRLNALREFADFLPIDSPTMLLAADLWAQSRAAGQPTDGDQALGADVILAAQALRCTDAQVVTQNRKHLARYVTIFPLEAHLPAM